MNTRKVSISALLLALTAGSVALPALARPNDCWGDGPMGGNTRQDMRGQRMQQHQQRLHDALKLSPEQEKAWAAFQQSHPQPGQWQRPDLAELDKLSAPERMEKMLERQKQHQEAMTQHLTALKTFYNQLSPEQKKTFDDFGMPRGPRGQGGPGAGGPMPGGTGPAPQPPAR